MEWNGITTGRIPCTYSRDCTVIMPTCTVIMPTCYGLCNFKIPAVRFLIKSYLTSAYSRAGVTTCYKKQHRSHNHIFYYVILLRYVPFSFRYPDEQVSIPIPLEIGKQYYLEAVHKSGTGLDHLSVGVTLPSGKNEWPIPKKYIRFRPDAGKRYP